MSDQHFIDVRFELEPIYYDGVTYFAIRAVTQSASTLEPDQASDFVNETLEYAEHFHTNVVDAIIHAFENKRTEL